jgi:hypothetical protein
VNPVVQWMVTVAAFKAAVATFKLRQQPLVAMA